MDLEADHTRFCGAAVKTSLPTWRAVLFPVLISGLVHSKGIVSVTPAATLGHHRLGSVLEARSPCSGAGGFGVCREPIFWFTDGRLLSSPAGEKASSGSSSPH